MKRKIHIYTVSVLLFFSLISNNKLYAESQYTNQLNYKEIIKNSIIAEMVESFESDKSKAKSLINYFKNISIYDNGPLLPEEICNNSLASIILSIFKILIFIYGIKNIPKSFSYIKKIIELNKIKTKKKVNIYNKIPDEDSSIISIKYLCNLYPNSNFLPATLLRLCIKKALRFEKNSENEIVIILNIENNRNISLESERIIYEELIKISDTGKFTVKQFEKYVKNNQFAFIEDIERAEHAAKIEQLQNGNFSKENLDELKTYTKLFGINLFTICFFCLAYLFVGLYSCLFTFFILIINLILLITIYIKLDYGTTEKGANEKLLWNGFKNYIQYNYLLKENKETKLAIWENYLIYSLILNVETSAIMQLNKAYPNLIKNNLVNNCSFLNVLPTYNIEKNSIDNTFNNFCMRISNSYGSAYNFVHPTLTNNS